MKRRADSPQPVTSVGKKSKHSSDLDELPMSVASTLKEEAPRPILLFELLEMVGKVLEGYDDPTWVSVAKTCRRLSCLLVPPISPTPSVRLKQNFLSLCAEKNYSDLLKWGFAQNCPWENSVAPHLAAHPSSLPLLTWAFSSGCPLPPATWLAAATQGDIETLSWLFASPCDWNSWALSEAGKEGHLHVIQWAHERNLFTKISAYRTLVEAAKNGHLDILMWMRGQGFPTDKLQSHACVGGNPKILTWLEEHLNFSGWTEYDYMGACLSGKLELVRWLAPKFSGSIIFHRVACAEAAKSGNLDLLKYLKSQGFPFDSRALNGAVESGNTELVNWLLSENCPSDTQACVIAARSGNIELLRNLRNHGIPWDEQTCSAAAQGGHVELLKWAHEAGCSWGLDIYAFILDRRSADTLQILKWLRKKNCPNQNPLIFNIAVRTRFAQISVVSWLYSKGFPWNNATLSSAAISGPLEVFKFLVDRECPFDVPSVVEAAVAGGNMPVLEWLAQQEYPLDEISLAPNFEMMNFLYREGERPPREWVATAAGNGDIRALEWLEERGQEVVTEDLLRMSERGRWTCLRHYEAKTGRPAQRSFSIQLREADPQTRKLFGISGVWD